MTNGSRMNVGTRNERKGQQELFSRRKLTNADGDCMPAVCVLADAEGNGSSQLWSSKFNDVVSEVRASSEASGMWRGKPCGFQADRATQLGGDAGACTTGSAEHAWSPPPKAWRS